MDRPFCTEDYTGTNRLELPDKLSMMGFREMQYMDDIAPLVFAKIRTMMGIPRDEFLLSVGPSQLLGNLLLGDLTSLSMKGSEGKSGSVFFTSFDGRFMIKSIPLREKQTVMRILAEYFEVTTTHSSLPCPQACISLTRASTCVTIHTPS